MGGPRPELVFLSGPQAGERAVLMADIVEAGRSPSCDVHLTEQHASRRQMQFQLTPDGWAVENLSVNRIRINGKRYNTETAWKTTTRNGAHR